MKKQKQTIQQKNSPLVSVVMPVYNAAGYIGESIESILNQTYKNFEFIMVDDRSSDDSYKIMKRYARKYPKKIKVILNCHNHHSANAVSKAIALAKGQFIARMDADDIALPNRLEKQVAYLLKHKKTVAVGTQCLLIDSDGAIIGEKKFPTAFKDIYNYIYSFCPAQQPTLMINRKKLPKDFQYYDHGMTPVEDVEFLFKLFQHGNVENMPDYLLMYRIHGKNSSLVNFKRSFFLTLISRIRAVYYYGYRPTVGGVITTFAQAITILLLPQSVTFFLYKIMKKINSPSPTSSAKEQFTLNVSKAL